MSSQEEKVKYINDHQDIPFVLDGALGSILENKAGANKEEVLKCLAQYALKELSPAASAEVATQSLASEQSKVPSEKTPKAKCTEAFRDTARVSQLHSIFNCKPVIMQAFEAASNRNDVGKTLRLQKWEDSPELEGLSPEEKEKALEEMWEKHVKTRGPSHVERCEYEDRMLLWYVREYSELMQTFEMIDTNDDCRIDMNEFAVMYDRQLATWGVKAKGTAAQEFRQIERNGAGSMNGRITFDEFAQWALSLGQDVEEDDDEA